MANTLVYSLAFGIGALLLSSAFGIETFSGQWWKFSIGLALLIEAISMREEK